MKRFIPAFLLFSIVLLPIVAIADNSSFNRNFEEYNNGKGIIKNPVESDISLDVVLDDCLEDSLTIEIMTDNYPYATTWELRDNFTNTIIDSGGPYTEMNTLYIHYVCVESTNCYLFTIFDTHGNGICCDYGNGYYNLYLNGSLVASGGEFGYYETTLIGEDCTPPTGACCVDLECVATNTLSECTTLGGDWYDYQDCSDFVCLRTCDSAIYHNGSPTGTPYASQCDPQYPVSVGSADDFILAGAGPMEINTIIAWFGHWNGNLNGPSDYLGVNVVIYNNDSVSVSGQNNPAGRPIDGDTACAHTEIIPDGIVYFAQLSPGEFLYYDDNFDRWRLDIPVDITLDAETRYWLEVQPVMVFYSAGQCGWINTDQQIGECARFNSQLLIPWWDVWSDSIDLAFCLLGHPGCDYVVGDINGSGTYDGLDIPYGVLFFKGYVTPQCDACETCPGWYYCGDVNGSCDYNGLDLTYGVAYFKGGAAPEPCADCPPVIQ